MAFQNVQLPVYTKREEIFNSVSHGVGVGVGVTALVLCLVKSHTGSSIAGSIIFAASLIILYLSSTLYHALKVGEAKKVFRLIDHSVIYIIILGTSSALNLITIYPHNKPFSLIMICLGFAISILGITLTLIDQEKYKKIQMVLYMVLGWMSLVLVYPIFKYNADAKKIIFFIVMGGVIYTLGTIFYGLGKSKKYFHSIFHLFVLVGTIFHFFGLYLAIA